MIKKIIIIILYITFIAFTFFQLDAEEVINQVDSYDLNKYFSKNDTKEIGLMLNLYVATNGSDTNPGTLAEPFLTLEKARDAIRLAKYGVAQGYGSIIGATWSGSGKAGNCLSFDGDNDYVDSKNGLSYDGVNLIPDSEDNSALDITDDLTISIWVKRADTEAATGLLARWGGIDSKGFALNIYSTKFEFVINTKTILSNSIYGVDGLWHHVVGVRASGVMKMYVDNVVQTATQATSTLSISTLDKLYIGRFDNDNNYKYYFKGLLDEARIYNRALSETEIGYLYTLSESSPTNGLVRYHKFDEGVNTLTHDDVQTRNAVTPVEATIWIRGGTYQLTESFVLDSEDSGAVSTPIIYKNYNNEVVHITGGKKITHWKTLQAGAIYNRLRAPAQAAVYQCDLTKDEGITDFGDMAVRPMQLFFDGTPQTLARYPNTGWLQSVLGENGVSPYTTSPAYITYAHADLDWMSGTIDDIWLYGFYSYEWAGWHQKVSAVTVATNTVTMVGAPPQYGYVNNRRFRYDNVLEELDVAGEYWIDRSTGILYFWPPSDITLKDSYVSILETPMITIDNCNYITIQGLIFEYTRGQVINADACDHIVIDDCTIRNIGASKTYNNETSHSISLILSSNCGVTNSEMYSLADGAIYLQGGTRTTLTPSNNYAKNNTIHDICLWNMSARYAVLVNGVGDLVSHNKIYNLPHQAIYIRGNNHIIEFNEIYNICFQTSDAGAIYAGRNVTERGNIVRNNYIHDIVDISTFGVYGIYLDDGECGFQMYGNIFDGVSVPILVKWGRDSLVANNISVNPITSSFLMVERASTGPPTDASILSSLAEVPYTTPPWSTAYPELVNILDDEPNKAKYNEFLCNIHYAPATNVNWITLTSLSFTTAYLTFTNNWMRGNPLFVDYANKDFQIADNSIVWQMGFQEIPIDDIGIGSTAVGTAMTFNNLPNMGWVKTNLKAGLKNGLKLYLPLNDEGQDIALDSSGNGHNGTLTDTTYDGVSWLGINAGKLGNGILLDGATGSYITIPDNDSLSFVTGGMSISVWAKRENTAKSEQIIGKCASAREYYLSFTGGATPKLYFQLYDTTNNAYRGRYAPNIAAGAWHHYVATYDGGTLSSGIKIYVDGVRVDNANYEAGATFVSMVNTTQPVRIGNIGETASYFDGSIDEVMIWNRALTQDEVTALYKLDIYASILNNAIWFGMNF